MSSSLRLPVFLLSYLLLVGCQSNGIELTPSASPSLLPYRSPTPTGTATQISLVAEPEGDLRATPTPFVHVVEVGETLLDVALQYGVTLGDLQTANPQIDPRFLSIGQQLRIPGPEGQPSESLLPTSTPIPLDVGEGKCLRSTSGAMWCLATVVNDTEDPVEGITARLQLLDEEGAPLASELAFTPLNRVGKEARMPVIAYFKPPAPAPAVARFELLSAVESEMDGDRYVPVELGALELNPADDRSYWEVVVSLTVEEGGQAALVAIGFDREGQAVGYTKWTAPSESEGPFEIDLTVYSLGPPIEEVQVMAEALRAVDTP